MWESGRGSGPAEEVGLWFQGVSFLVTSELGRIFGVTVGKTTHPNDRPSTGIPFRPKSVPTSTSLTRSFVTNDLPKHLVSGESIESGNHVREERQILQEGR